MKIGNNTIGEIHPTFVIAEAGVNHNGCIQIARFLIDAAKWAGADAVKFQIYQTDKLVGRDTPAVGYQKKRGYDKQYQMLKSCELSYKQFEYLARYARKKGIMFLATPHSCLEDVDLVAKLCPAIKVGSGSLINIPFLKYIASKKKPVILSTGMGNVDEIVAATNLFDKDMLAILQCTSEYPCPPERVNLNAMETISLNTGVEIIGLSDHSESLAIPAAAVAIGATIIEKHLTYGNYADGPDHIASLEPLQFKHMVQNIRDVEAALGDFSKRPTRDEMKIRKVTRERGYGYGGKI